MERPLQGYYYIKNWLDGDNLLSYIKSMDSPEEKQRHKESHHVASHENEENDSYGYHEVKTLLSWSAPGRPFIKRGKQFYMTALLLALLIEVILFLFSQYLFMVLIIALVFVSFAFAAVPPKNFHYKISTEGVTVEDHFYLWHELYDFYFRPVERHDILHIRTASFFPGELIISLGEVHKDQIKHAMLPFLPYRETVKPTFTEKGGDWLYKNFPLEKTS